MPLALVPPAASRRAVAVSLLAALAAAGSAAAQSYTIRELPSLGGWSTSANDLNDAGVVVGFSTRDQSAMMRPVKWVNGVVSDLDPHNWWAFGEAVAVNAAGAITSNQGTALNCFPQGVTLFHPGGSPLMRFTPGNALAEGRAMNDAGTIVGCMATDASGMNALRWVSTSGATIGAAGGAVTEALGVNAAGAVVGHTTQGSGVAHAFLFSGGVLSDLPTPAGRLRAHARDINASGLVVGDADNGANPCSWVNIESRAVVWEGGAARALPMPMGMSEASATDVNDFGEIVGLGMVNWTFQPVLWRAGGFDPALVSDLLPADQGWASIKRVNAINNKGQMVGWGYRETPRGAVQAAFILSPCWGDFNATGGTTVQDVFDYLAAYFAGSPRADVNRTAGVNTQDLFDFLGSYFGGCR